MRFDVHTHAFHPKVATRSRERLQEFAGTVPAGAGTAEDLILRLQRAKLDKAVVHTAATAPSQVTPANNWAIKLNSLYPELIAFGTMHLDCDSPEKELDRLEQAGILGLKFHPELQGFALNDPRFMQLMECINDRFVLMIHLGADGPMDKSHSSPKKLLETHKMFPNTQIIAAHLGGYKYWEEALTTLAGTTIWMDTSSTLSHIAPEQLQRVLKAHPTERILFGSDYPLFDPATEMQRLQKGLGLSDEETERYLTAAGALFGE